MVSFKEKDIYRFLTSGCRLGEGLAIKLFVALVTRFRAFCSTYWVRIGRVEGLVSTHAFAPGKQVLNA